jgi:hypothetical protein
MFDDPLKPLKKASTIPVQNIIYKPFDLTILKEHTRFAISLGKKIKTLYVHTTQVETAIESIKKFKIKEFSEFGFKIEKNYPLEKNKAYKFYHPIYTNKKNQHIWARFINETETHYEMHFCQSVSVIINQLRKKIATTKSKVKNPVWLGQSQNKQTALTIALQLSDEDLVKTLQELLDRNFKNLTFIPNSEIDPKKKTTADLLITEVNYEEKTLDAQFTSRPIVIRLNDDAPIRAELEKRFLLEFIRIQKPIDRSFLVKVLRNLFPELEEKQEEIQEATALVEENTSLSEVIKVQEFSEAAISFSDPHQYELGLVMNIALPQDDETTLKEIKAKIHFVSEKPNPDKVFLYQFVLYGMKDEFLKNIRLWALQKHIEKNKAG